MSVTVRLESVFVTPGGVPEMFLFKSAEPP